MSKRRISIDELDTLTKNSMLVRWLRQVRGGLFTTTVHLVIQVHASDETKVLWLIFTLKHEQRRHHEPSIQTVLYPDLQTAHEAFPDIIMRPHGLFPVAVHAESRVLGDERVLPPGHVKVLHSLGIVEGLLEAASELQVPDMAGPHLHKLLERLSGVVRYEMQLLHDNKKALEELAKKL